MHDVSALVAVHVSDIKEAPAVLDAVVPTIQPAPEVAELHWRERFPGTAAALEAIEARHQEAERARREAAERQRKREEARRIALLSRTKEGRIELARMATEATKRQDEARRQANLAAGRSAAAEENKQKRAMKRERDLQLAAQKKSEQASQGRGSK